MKLVLAETITPTPVSATSKKIVPKPATTAAESTYNPVVTVAQQQSPPPSGE